MSGIQPLPYWTTRRIAAAVLPPIQIGGWGRCTGGCSHIGLVAVNPFPLTGVSGSVQIDRSAANASSSSWARSSTSTPSAANSERAHAGDQPAGRHDVEAAQ
jgi:hypothetical protein